MCADSMRGTIIDMVDDEDNPLIRRGAAGKAPAHLSQYIDDEAEEFEEIDEDDDEEEVLDLEDQAEKDLERKRDLARWKEEELEEGPDLGEYFAEFDLTEQQQIAMCRTYANYLAQRCRARAKTPSGPKKGGTWKGGYKPKKKLKFT